MTHRFAPLLALVTVVRKAGDALRDRNRAEFYDPHTMDATDYLTVEPAARMRRVRRLAVR